MILEKIPRKHILLDGLIGSGKRTLARAIGNEFGGKVVELDPGSVTNQRELLDVVENLGRDDALIAHNIDEWGEEAQRDMVSLMVDRVLKRESTRASRSHPFAAAFELNFLKDGCTSPQIEPFIVIVTTNAAEIVNSQIRSACFHFSLVQNREGMTIATERALRYNGVPADSHAVSILVDYFMASQCDVAEETMSLVLSHLQTVGAVALLPEYAANVVKGGWAFQPFSAVVAAVKAAMNEMGTKNLQEVAIHLRLPLSITAQIAKVLKKPTEGNSELKF